MTEPSSPRRRVPHRGPSLRTGVCLLSAATILSLAIGSGWLAGAPAAAQGPQVPGPGQPPAVPNLPPGPGMPALPGGVNPQEPAAAKAEEPPTPAERLIDEAGAKIAKLKSVAATLVETVEMLNQRLTIRGKYLKAPDYRVYLQLTVSGPPETGGTTLQICDGDILWDYQEILKNQTYRKLSIKPIVDRLGSPELDPKLKDQALREMGLAGPETFLTGIRQLFRFESKEEGTHDGKPVWIIHGKWKTRQGLMGPDSRPVPQVGMLPSYIPGMATLTIGKEDGWPYKLVLQGQKPSVLIDLKAHPELDTRKKGPDGRVIGSLSSIETVEPTKISLEYSDVKLNPALNVTEFVFQAPPASSVEDNTEMIVRQLDQAIRLQAEKKKSDAAKKEEGVLDQPLNVPAPPAGPAANP
jgi:outer membrane lipoprotein-sorting protein